jgi:hypothetical protein
MASSSRRSDKMINEERLTAHDAGPVDGLKLLIGGDELRTLLEERIGDHRRRADWWKREQARTPEEQTEDHPLLPDHICENEAERHEWRADVLGFIRDHVDPAARYRLGENDLVFGELLPETPGWIEQEQYEERTSVGFNLERLTKRVGELTSGLDSSHPRRNRGTEVETDTHLARGEEHASGSD